MGKLAEIFGGNITDGVAKIISLFKIDPTVAAQNAEKLQEIQSGIVSKMIDATATEVQAQADIIKAEAQSQSWLPRNVRPLLLLMWGSAITLNVIITILAHFHAVNWTPIPLDPWVYKLTAGGFGGYVSLRTIEKLKGVD